MTQSDRTANIVIIGGGIAGLLTALKLAPLPVTLISATRLTEASAIKATDRLQDTSFAWPSLETPEALENHITETINAGRHLADDTTVRNFCSYLPEARRHLEALGLSGTKTTEHTRTASIRAALIAALHLTPSITVLEGYEAEELICEGDAQERRATGFFMTRPADAAARYKVTNLHAIVLATGGVRGLYHAETSETGERAASTGLAIGARAGAIIADAEFVHFASTEPSESAPVARFHIGGLRTNDTGRTNISGLWAVGEVAATGLHGAAGLPSNMLAETIALAINAAVDITTNTPPTTPLPIANLLRERTPHLPDFGARNVGLTLIRETLSIHSGRHREDAGLRQALATLQDIATAGAGDPAIANATLAARFITEAALRRRESRGVHQRADYPAIDETLARRRTMTMAGLDLRASLASGELFSEITAADAKLH